MKIVKKLGKSIKKWWKEFTMDADEIYISKATDIVDLENRLRTVSRRMINKL